MFFGRFLVLCIVALTTGCAATLPPKVPVPENAKIGVLVLVDQKPKHVHVGSMIFNNSERLDASDWGLVEAIHEHARDQLDGVNGQTVVSVTAAPALLEHRLELTFTAWDTPAFNEKLTNVMDEAVSGKGLDFIVTVEPYQATLEVNGTVQAEGYGLFTRCRLSMCSAKGLNNVTARVYALNPTRLVSWGEASKYDFPVDLDLSGDLKTLPASEIDKAKDPIIGFVFERVDSALDRAGLARRLTKEMPR